MAVDVQVFVPGLYFAPVSKYSVPSILIPPQTIISLPVHTAVCSLRSEGALAILVGVHVSVLGSYLPPVLKPMPAPCPPQTIISLPVQTAV